MNTSIGVIQFKLKDQNGVGKFHKSMVLHQEQQRIARRLDDLVNSATSAEDGH